MTSDPQSQPSGQDEDRTRRLVRWLALLLLILLCSFCCMLSVTQVSVWRLRGAETLDRDVRSGIEVDYGAGEQEDQREHPLDPRAIEDKEAELESTRTPRPFTLVTVVPVAEIPLTGTPVVAQITPMPSFTPVPTPTPSPPTDTPRPQPSDTPETPPPSDTPLPSDTPTVTPLPPTVTPVLPTPTDTPAPTWTDTPEPTWTDTPEPTWTDTPEPTWTDTPEPTWTDTPEPTWTDTPEPTWTDTPVPPLEVWSITPNETVRSSTSLNVAITGQGFIPGPSAYLSGGSGAQSITQGITVLSFDDGLINGSFVPDIPAGVYALTVQNTNAQSDTLSPAFTVIQPPHPDRTLDSTTALISTFGPAAAPTQGDSDYVQIIFFEVPDTAPDNLYVRIFDADTGADNDVETPPFNTTMTYALRGGAGAYTDADARSHAPGPQGIGSGTLITQAVVGVDPTLNNAWLALPATRTQGELFGGRRIFKLVVQGASGDDGNGYHAVLSAAQDSNVAVTDARTFAFSWGVVLPSPGDQVSLYPYVPVGAGNVYQFNFDFDAPSSGAEISLTTPAFYKEVFRLSGDGATEFEQFIAWSLEDGTTWTARYVTGATPTADNSFCLWFRETSQTGPAMAIFTAPTMTSQP